jgi:hypothetical protein
MDGWPMALLASNRIISLLISMGGPLIHVFSMLVSETGNRLYSATVADLSLRDAIIYSKPLRTEQHDSQWLNGTYIYIYLYIYI